MGPKFSPLYSRLCGPFRAFKAGKCLAALLSAYLVITLGVAPLSVHADGHVFPTLPSFPLSSTRLQVSASPRVELLQLLLALMSRQAISLDTQARAAALGNLGKLSKSPALDSFATLEKSGLTRSHWLALILAHGEPRSLSPDRNMPRLLPPWGTQLSDRDRAKLLDNIRDDLQSLWDDAQMEPYFQKYTPYYRELEQVLGASLPGNTPLDELRDRRGDISPAVVLVPSPLALTLQWALMPAPGGGVPTLVVVLPLPPGGLPDQGVELEALRYEGVTRARLDDILQSFSLELAFSARLLTEGKRAPGPGGGASLQLGGARVLDDERLRQSVVRALFHRSLGADRQALAEAENTALRRGLAGVPEMAAELTRLDADLTTYPTFYTQVPMLLEAAVAATLLPGKDNLPPGDFELWEGGRPVGWTLTADRVSGVGDKPTRVERVNTRPPTPPPVVVKGRRTPPPPPPLPPDYGVRLVASADTRPFQYVLSEPVPVSPGDVVTVSGQIRVEGVAAAAGNQLIGAHLFLLQQANEGAMVRRTTGKPQAGTQDFQESRIEVVIPAGVAVVRVGLGLGMAGVADFDDVVVTVKRRPVQYLLHDGGFEVAAGDGVWGWEKALLVQSPVVGPSGASVVALDEREPWQGRTSLVLRGESHTASWYGPRSPAIECRPGRKVVVTAMTRSENVRHEGLQSRNANLLLEFINERGQVVGSANSDVLDGTRPWTLVKLEASAPLDTVAVRVTGQLTMSGSLWLDDIHLAQR